MLRQSTGGRSTTLNKLTALTISRPADALVSVQTAAYEADCVYADGKFYVVNETVAEALGNVKAMELFVTVLPNGSVNLFPVTFLSGTWRETALEALEMALDQPLVIKSNNEVQEYQATPAKNLTLGDFKIPEDIDAFIQANISKVTLSDLDHPIVKKLLKAQGGK
jgi:hypothetical protein